MFNCGFAKNEHIELISEFEKDVFGSEAYSLNSLNEMMKDNYLLHDNDNIFEISDEEELIGYIIFNISLDFTDIYKIFIREKNRKLGLGKKLIDEVYNLARRYKSKKIMLEVREKNTNAINFYKSIGFNQISIRENYYKNPLDNALIFEKNIEV